MWIVALGVIGLLLGVAMAMNVERRRVAPVAALTAVGLVIGVLIGSIRVVPAGHVGVVDLFGVVDPRPLRSGLNMVNPLVRIIPVSIRTQEDKEIMSVPSREGLTVDLEISTLYRLQPEAAAEVYRTVGHDYADVVFRPQFRAVVRGVTSSSDAKALYTAEREVLASQIQEHLQQMVKDRGLVIESVLPRKITLPPTVRDAIEQKLKAEQDAERMKFVLQRETQEAERKRVEAQGIRDAQAIIAESLTDQYLHYLWINTLNQNSNVIYVATEANMPLFRTVDQDSVLLKSDSGVSAGRGDRP